MSSSCEIKTCWLSTPDFQTVGDRLKKLYDESVQVTRGNTIEEKIVPKMNAIAAADDDDEELQSYEKGGNLNRKMIYFERSPTYCDTVSDIGIIGTEGRVCNNTSNDLNSCSTLCCGRGYFTVKVRRIEKCNCEFHWCCYVVCQKCEYDEWVTICK